MVTVGFDGAAEDKEEPNILETGALGVMVGFDGAMEGTGPNKPERGV